MENVNEKYDKYKLTTIDIFLFAFYEKINSLSKYSRVLISYDIAH